MDTRHFHKLLDDAVLRLAGPDARIVCAVSGGADSMALLHGLSRVRELRSRRWHLSAAHLNHQIPSNAEAMSAFVRATCVSLDVPFHGDAADVPALASATGESIESAGRTARYAFLERVCAESNADALAVAHHADDQAETVLYRVLRGTGLRGLAGIPEARPLSDRSRTRLIRPLLRVRRADCIAYLDRRGLRYMHDETNDDIRAATRNRIRHDLLPRIERDINPQAVAALARLADQASAAADLVDGLSAALLDGCTVETGADEIVCDVDRFCAGHEFVRAAAIRLAIERLGGAQRETGHERLTAAVAVASSGRGDGRAELPDGITVERRGRFLHIRVARARR